MFEDKYKRPIHLGDFIANGHRAGSSGGLSVGIVFGFTEKSIQVDTILEGHLWRPPEGGYDTVYYWGKTNFFAAEHCYVIRGITLDQFTEGIEVLSAVEYKRLCAERMALWRAAR